MGEKKEIPRFKRRKCAPMTATPRWEKRRKIQRARNGEGKKKEGRQTIEKNS